jgi:hypothetical protein
MAFILEPGMIIIGTGSGFEEISYESNFTYVADFQKRKENRSLITGSKFENSYGSKHWLLYVGDFKNKPVFQHKFFTFVLTLIV